MKKKLQDEIFIYLIYKKQVQRRDDLINERIEPCTDEIWLICGKQHQIQNEIEIWRNLYLPLRLERLSQTMK